MTEATRVTEAVEQLTDAAFEPFLATARGWVVVAFSTAWSMNCRLMRPLVARLALRHGCEVTVVALDGDEAHQFRARYGVDSTPQLLAFEKRRLVARYTGAPEPDAVQAWFRAALRLASGGEGRAEAAFRAAWQRAHTTFDELIGPAQRIAHPHLDAAAQHMDVFERELAAEREAGLLSDDEEMERRSHEFERIFAPFRPALDALSRAEQTAIQAYEDMMAEALDEYAVERAREPQGCRAPAVGAFCS